MASNEEKPAAVALTTAAVVAADKEKKSSWKDSIYNPRTGELLGRTASSWGKILGPTRGGEGGRSVSPYETPALFRLGQRRVVVRNPLFS
jgi:hypothetical protein